MTAAQQMSPLEHARRERERQRKRLLTMQERYGIGGAEMTIPRAKMAVTPWETDEHGNLSRQIYQVEQ